MVSYSIVLFLLASSISASVSFHTVHIQRRPKTFSEYVSHASREALVRSKRGASVYPFVADIGVVNSDFYTNVSIGTPPQEFKVLLNTGMTGTWIPSAMCPMDKYDMCKNHRMYYQNKSSTYISKQQRAGYGGMVAELSSDTVSIAGVSVMGQTFAEVIQYNFNDSSIPYDGMFGLGLAGKIFVNHSSIFTNMVDQYIIDEIVYGLYFIKNSSNLKKSGGLIIGGRNASLFVGKLTFVNSTENTTWQFTVDKIVLLDSSKMPPLCEGGCNALPATGSHFISANHRLMDILHRNLGATVFTDDYTYQFNCSSLEKLPSVYFSIGDTLFKIPWQSYVDKITGPAQKPVCLSSFVGLDDIAGSSWYLGDAFFASVYVEFDMDKQRIGFAELNSNI